MDKLFIRKICIDDFALKKREKSATVMIDIENRKVVDILNSRDLEDVKRWLSEYPNIQLVCRDGLITYSKAIRDSHYEAIQVADRFHILKNLTDYLKSYIKRTVRNTIDITDNMGKNSINEDKYNNKTTPEIKKQNLLKIKEKLIKKQKSLEIKVYHLAKLVEKWIYIEEP